jgi:phage-related protein
METILQEGESLLNQAKDLMNQVAKKVAKIAGNKHLAIGALAVAFVTSVATIMSLEDGKKKKKKFFGR